MRQNTVVTIALLIERSGSHTRLRAANLARFQSVFFHWENMFWAYFVTHEEVFSVLPQIAIFTKISHFSGATVDTIIIVSSLNVPGRDSNIGKSRYSSNFRAVVRLSEFKILPTVGLLHFQYNPFYSLLRLSKSLLSC